MKTGFENRGMWASKFFPVYALGRAKYSMFSSIQYAEYVAEQTLRNFWE